MTQRAIWLEALAWVLQVAAAAVFLFAGYKKLTGDPMMVQIFDGVGIGQWFRLLTGGLEIGGGIGLLIPRTSAVSALLLAIVMIGAIMAHLFRIGGNPLPAILLLVVCMGIAWLRRERLAP